jgi:hypothetical protein
MGCWNAKFDATNMLILTRFASEHLNSANIPNVYTVLLGSLQYCETFEPLNQPSPPVPHHFFLKNEDQCIFDAFSGGPYSALLAPVTEQRLKMDFAWAGPLSRAIDVISSFRIGLPFVRIHCLAFSCLTFLFKFESGSNLNLFNFGNVQI